MIDLVISHLPFGTEWAMLIPLRNRHRIESPITEMTNPEYIFNDIGELLADDIPEPFLYVDYSLNCNHRTFSGHDNFHNLYITVLNMYQQLEVAMVIRYFTLRE